MAVQDRTNNEELLQMAMKAAKGGNKDGARVMFRQVYGRDHRNETAMLWLAKIARSEQEREQWLKRILDVNPDNTTAQKAMSKMEYKRESQNNRTLVIFGGVVAVMILVILAIVLVVAL